MSENTWTDQDDKGYVEQYEMNFLYGIVIFASKPHIKIPIPVSILLGSTMFITITIHACMYAYTMDLMDELINYGLTALILSSLFCTFKYRREIHSPTRDVDSWGEFTYLEEVAKEMKLNAKEWVQRFSSIHMILMNVGSVAYCLVPIGKYLYLEPSDPMDLLIFHVLFPLDTDWGFYSTYFFQSVIIICVSLGISRVFGYKIICFVTIGRQMRLIGSALSSLEQRVGRLIIEKKYCNGKSNNNIHLILEQEIKKCAIQFQTIYRAANETTSLFRPVTTVIYHFGMWVICAMGVKLATEQRLFVQFQMFMILHTILLNQYIYSVGSEYLKKEVEELKLAAYTYPWYKMPKPCQKSILTMITSMDSIPCFNTVIGTQTNLENFGKIPGKDQLLTSSDNGYEAIRSF